MITVKTLTLQWPQKLHSLLHKLRWSFIAQSTVQPPISVASSFEPELPKTSQHMVRTLIRVFAHCVVALYQRSLWIPNGRNWQRAPDAPEQLLPSKKPPICCYMLTEKKFACLTVVSVSAWSHTKLLLAATSSWRQYHPNLALWGVLALNVTNQYRATTKGYSATNVKCGHMQSFVVWVRKLMRGLAKSSLSGFCLRCSMSELHFDNSGLNSALDSDAENVNANSTVSSQEEETIGFSGLLSWWQKL